jgi:membrane protease YdiL (CAAX protease family)
VQNATQDEIDSISKRFGKLSIIIPHNGSELARFYALAVTAGIVEEILWRGFLIWYLNQFMPLWAAAVISTIGFALAHAYQGLANLPQITAVSAALAALYLISGSIWFPIVLHAAIDILQGRLGYDINVPEHDQRRRDRVRLRLVSHCVDDVIHGEAIGQ